MELERRNIVIVGTGPAGCASAIAAGKGGFNVTVLEKRTREDIINTTNTSFEALQNLTQDEDVLDMLQDLGLEIDPVCTYKGAVVTGPSGGEVRIELKRPHGYFVRRKGRGSIDHQLIRRVEKAGIDIRFGSRVLEVSERGCVKYEDENGIGTINAKMVIGADGKGTTVGKGYVKKLNKKDIALGIEYHFPNKQ
ncbi:MAG: FAD-dependent monooxygenase [Candidatus Thermoplasmatota archaeon]|nr:FAD-dependent monooxygenase [Candidatus Thermoplasmatota archaeon]